ncbi:MAG: endonuclease/exonuclease/phosphatase family protein [candidate division KSB1 bacterium]|nr:endonuclease/exonuclease/phosphatase family protein [candidate division KSB1 bacterium]MDZ7275877.1 endonuclease/exonuclease/phosphatase family protein [candidate division KSB1 bacterium]MDZ7287627.1 endonuclease/exonuclease/phosphatase family protein [candidate division KSB1 bacterium]MDZ7306789.1 endonuclease/exonuclease/phosphatase family protein [candidate division KSB1 bacterium]MDZ7350605.1 endonuclease/exonuclease/phosphatase family protein [candidate division KSB1 bacterium]
MAISLRLATFNLENFDDKPGQSPTLADRIAVMRPQLQRLRADVLCLQEVNGQEQTGQPRQLPALQRLLQNTPYAAYHLAYTRTSNNQAYDERNLVVVSRFPVIAQQQIRHDYAREPLYRKMTAIPAETEAKAVTWERPILHVTLDLGGGRKLHVINLHLKSKVPGNIPGQQITQDKWRTVAGWAEGYFISSMKRVGQALETRMLIDQLFDAALAAGEEALIVVAGDFNADLDDVPIHAIRGQVEDTGNPALLARVLAPCELSVPASARYSFLHLGRGMMLDHILVSRPLLAYYRGTEIHNETLPDESGAFRTDVEFPESDHAPVVAEFELP